MSTATTPRDTQPNTPYYELRGYYVMDEVGSAGRVSGPFPTFAEAESDRNIAEDCGVWFYYLNGTFAKVQS